MFSRAVTAAAQSHGVAEYPREAAGLVVDGAYLPCENLAADPTRGFDLDDGLWITYRGRIEAVIHSHPEDWPVPSERDMRQQIAMDLPWGIYSTQKAASPTAPEPVTFSPVVWFGRQVAKGPLIGRGFIHGFQDCLSAIEDWHAVQGVTLPQSPRSWEWWMDKIGPDGEIIKAKNFYLDLFEPYGFEQIDGPVIGAVFMGALGKDMQGRNMMTPNHAGIFLGNNRVLHHRTTAKAIDMSRPSCRVAMSMRDGYFNAPPIWVRHKSLPLKGLKEI